ncbi:MAG: 5'/3'-nucleotidase SurE [Deltaproteobacteria bacterium]|nr:MAG: 5'/3'-nucleotidase SurE [Deltaproteobacteria bacterium]
MRILLVNDDGIHAKGIHVLQQAAQAFGECITVAPHDESSAVSHAITLHAPLRLRNHGPNAYAVTGTPTDCAYIGLHKVLDPQPDLLLSGINYGPNLGIDVLYSGTVAAAMEGSRAGVPSVAFSLATRHPTDEDWETAGRVVREFLTWYLDQPPLPQGKLLNVNIPKGPLPTPAPFRAVRLGEVDYPPDVASREDPRGGYYYWIGGKPPRLGDEPDTDTGSILEKHVSVTPLHLDLTDYSSLGDLQNRLTSTPSKKET